MYTHTEGPLAAAEPGDVFAEVSGALGHEMAEMAHDFDADLLVDVVLGLLALLLEQRVKVLAVFFELEEPAHVVDAGHFGVDFLFRHTDVSRNQVQGGLDILRAFHVDAHKISMPGRITRL